MEAAVALWADAAMGFKTSPATHALSGARSNNFLRWCIRIMLSSGMNGSAVCGMTGRRSVAGKRRRLIKALLTGHEVAIVARWTLFTGAKSFVSEIFTAA